ncbi:MAG TPA: K(+)-transporting ATPase subunit F [Candidatus Eisenbacteria bacterium]|nr:K(+)-transporting ATPase subunit F [Candidatus Eisenbacteria bacterium]
MTIAYGVALVVAIVLFLYLVYAILKPERFG